MPGVLWILLEVLQLVAAGVLIVAGATKLVQPAGIRDTLSTLDLPHQVRAIALLAAWEIATGAALILSPGWITGASIIALGMGFVLAGLIAVARGLNVDCACGAGLAGRLGWQQVVAVPIWALVAVAVVIAPTPLADRWPLAIGLVIAITLGVLARGVPAMLEHRELRVLWERWE